MPLVAKLESGVDAEAIIKGLYPTPNEGSAVSGRFKSPLET